MKNFSLVGYLSSCDYPDLANSYLDNLVRLKLIDIRDLTLADESLYIPLESHNNLCELLEEISIDPDREVEFERHIASVTELGRQFCSICISSSEDDA